MIALKHLGAASAALILYAGLSFATSITESDSTQPRGSEPGFNANGQVLDPIIDDFRNPARFPGIFHDDWAGSIMAHATRDPSFYAALNVANRDYINLLEKC
ncbi:MAG: hypothetical protein AB2565_16840 [Candidatus Thiodiazotropha endolucinida]|uniref:Uncharacterized protein n=1 Tax=Candidatus Thiodiazotropha endolucinida TaxID=1655433 RepID=A0A7Z0VPS9_9GAMM|nr:hypothetical protein [Candidatus Thiodiazotropha endolucinida]ODJ89071.1 hypothetical protein CODIS_06830 [Candidatus Thiodiazotropha endolucinida]